MSLPRTETFSHDADVGVVGRGATVADALVAAAEATFAEMADPAAVRPLRAVRIGFDEADPEFALVTWLNACLAEARAAGLALGRFSLWRDGDHWAGEAWGEPWHDDLPRGTEVKGATLTELAVTPVDGGWEARCVVDV
jgi:SHS2 domain-containing protein